MSSTRGRGQGAWASHRTMASEVGEGADYTRFSVSVNKLVGLGYLQRDRLAGDARKHTYRVQYTDDDRLPRRKPAAEGDSLRPGKAMDQVESLPDCDNQTEIVCPTDELSVGDRERSDPQYISQSEEVDSVETREINSPEGAQPRTSYPSRSAFRLNIGAQLAILERALRAQKEIDLAAWYSYLNDAWNHPDHRGWCSRLADEVEDLLGIK